MCKNKGLERDSTLKEVSTPEEDKIRYLTSWSLRRIRWATMIISWLNEDWPVLTWIQLHRATQASHCIFNLVKGPYEEIVNFYWFISRTPRQWPGGMEPIAFVASLKYHAWESIPQLYFQKFKTIYLEAFHKCFLKSLGTYCTTQNTTFTDLKYYLLRCCSIWEISKTISQK